jgi:hypothetical protein
MFFGLLLVDEGASVHVEEPPADEVVLDFLTACSEVDVDKEEPIIPDRLDLN